MSKNSKKTTKITRNTKVPSVANKMTTISFKEINENYSLGKYGDFNVIIMKSNGYINATKLCSDAVTKSGKQKTFRHWKKNTGAKELMEEASDVNKFSIDDISIVIAGGNLPEIRGTYVHPDLIPHIVSWVSPKFAVRASKIINKYFLRKAVKEQEKIIEKKDNKIDKLSGKIDILIENNKELLDNNKELLNKNSKMDNRIKRLSKKNNEMFEQNEEIIGKIDVINNDRVVTTGDKNDEHTLAIIANNDDPEEYDDDETIYSYCVIRTMARSLNARIASHMDRHPNMRIIMKINYSPNAVNLWVRIRKELGLERKKIIISHCSFNLKGRYSERRLIADIKKIHNERFDDIDELNLL